MIAGTALLLSLLVGLALLFIYLFYVFPRHRASVFRGKVWQIRDELVFDRLEGRISKSEAYRLTLAWIDDLISHSRRLTLSQGVIVLAVALMSREVKLGQIATDTTSAPRYHLAAISKYEADRLSSYLDRIDRAGVRQICFSSVLSVLLIIPFGLFVLVYSIIKACVRNGFQRKADTAAQLPDKVHQSFEADFRLIGQRMSVWIPSPLGSANAWARDKRDLSAFV
jgi:hypothetical protein